MQYLYAYTEHDNIDTWLVQIQLPRKGSVVTRKYLLVRAFIWIYYTLWPLFTFFDRLSA